MTKWRTLLKGKTTWHWKHTAEGIRQGGERRRKALREASGEEINVLVNSDGVFVATNDPNPVRWIEVSPGTYAVDPNWEQTNQMKGKP